MAAADSLERQPGSFRICVSLKGFSRIARTCRLKAAIGAEKRTNKELIESDQRKSEKLNDFAE